MQCTFDMSFGPCVDIKFIFRGHMIKWVSLDWWYVMRENQLGIDPKISISGENIIMYI